MRQVLLLLFVLPLLVVGKTASRGIEYLVTSDGNKDFGAFQAEFGPNLERSLSAELAHAQPAHACQPLQDSHSNNIVLIRQVCTQTFLLHLDDSSDT